MKERNKGISMISLVITIIVIIILASVSFNSSTETISKANYSNYVSNVAEVKQAFNMAVAARKGKEAKKGKIKETAQVVQAVATGSDTYMLNSEATGLGYVIITEAAEEELDMKLPKMAVETKTADDVEVKYVVTMDGTVFAWPPIAQNGVYYSTGEIIAEMTETTGSVNIGGNKIAFNLDQYGGIDAPRTVGDVVKLTSTTPGSSVTYPVSYAGVNGDDKLYTAEDGWKLLKATKNAKGNYDIEIVSVGLPVGVYYHYQNPGTWWGSEGSAGQCAKYNSELGTNWGTSDPRIRAAAGLYYNLGSMNFVGDKTTTSTINEAYYKQIGENTKETLTGANLLKASEIAGSIKGVRAATKAEIESIEATDAARKRGSGSTNYWLASPNSDNAYYLYYVNNNGSISNSYSHSMGVRCVVSISNVPLQSGI